MTEGERKRAIETASEIAWRDMRGRYSPDLHVHLIAAWRQLQPDPVLGTSRQTTRVIFGGRVTQLGSAEVDELLDLFDKASLEIQRLRQRAEMPTNTIQTERTA